MSHREPLWYCYEMDNPSDNPREFGHSLDTGDLDSDTYIRPFMFIFPALHFKAYSVCLHPEILSESTGVPLVAALKLVPNGVRTYTIGGSNAMGGRPPTMSEFHRRDFGADRRDSGIDGSLMTQYLLTLLGGPTGSLNEMNMVGWVTTFSIKKLMESNAHHPVPATEQIMKELPREVLVSGCTFTSRSYCRGSTDVLRKPQPFRRTAPVCKEQFSLETEDPDEQVVVTLPCSHPFHEPCILPWLKSSGTCPVCRHQLIPQPEHHSQPGTSQTSGNGPRTASRSRSPAAGGDPAGFLQSLFGSSMRLNRSSSDRRGGSSSRGGNHVPGAWDELD
ncbi:hypothetical protein IW261DRAFT_1418771 [Armillaria novae-zelandiae]|uniref:RING-type domain-containing protein n=1 Tax=Armillaria novae-zelandiae TaxID=153914 RepID=A0AA39UJT1_9AGAR|nr:hypothetical protein IW261DRAFT_1418771 [Armillaria novae-zelandiae]